MSQQPSLKKNFFYKALLTVANPLLGIITFPYISRVLGVENVGLVNFVDNTINYFLLFATMGIGSIGVRAIAASRDSQDNLNKTFSNLLGMNLMFTFATLFVYNILILCIPSFNQYYELFILGNAKILFTSLLVEWFFNGMENFKYITIRTLLIRLLYILMVFLLIRDSNDYIVYFILTISVIVVNAFINLAYLRRFTKIILKELLNHKFLKENILLGFYAIMTSMYLTFNVMYLGLMSNNVEVGYYTSAFKLYYLILSVFSAFTSVMLPRMSSLIAKGDMQKFSSLIDKSVSFVALLAIPIVVCGSILAPELIEILCGTGYEGAILPMRIIMPALLLVGIAQIIANQILMPNKKDNVLLKVSVIGAVTAVVINITVVPHLNAIGSALVLLTSELLVTFSYLVYVQKHKMIDMHWGRFIRPILTTIPCAIVCLWAQSLSCSPFCKLLICVPLSVVIYFTLNFRNIKYSMLTQKSSM